MEGQDSERSKDKINTAKDVRTRQESKKFRSPDLENDFEN